MIPLSGRVPGRASGPSQSRDNGGGGLHYVSWKSVCPFRVFPSKGIYRHKGDVSGGPGAHTTWWRGQGVARATLWCDRLLVRPRLSSGLRLPFR
jgi:hypothetical protein